METKCDDESTSVRRSLIGTSSIAFAMLAIGAAMGIKAEYDRGQRDWSELIEWGASPFIGLALLLAFAVPIALWLLRRD